MVFDELKIPGDDSDYYILEEEYETISLNDIVWDRVKNEDKVEKMAFDKLTIPGDDSDYDILEE